MSRIKKSVTVALLLSTTASIQAADFNKDGIPDLVFKSSEGYLKTWEVDSSYAKTERWLTNLGSTSWKVFAECGDLNGDGNADIIIQDETTGYIKALQMSGFTKQDIKWIGNPGGAEWKIKDIDDIDGNGYPDIILQNSTNGYIKAYRLSANFSTTDQWIGNPGTGWEVEDVSDIDGDGTEDIVMQNSSNGYIKAFKLSSDFSKTDKWIGNPGGSEWDIKDGTSDIDGDGVADIVLQNSSNGYIKAFKLDSDFSKTDKWIGNPSGSDWEISSVSDLDGDGVEDVVLQNTTNGYLKAYQVNSSFSATSKWIGNPGGLEWEAIEVEDMDGDGQSDVILQNTTNGYVKAYDIDSTFKGTNTWIGNAGSSWDVDGDGEEKEDEDETEDENDDIGSPPSIPSNLLTSGYRVVVERGAVLDSNVTDADGNVAYQVSDSNNTYIFEEQPVYPITAQGGWIDVDGDGNMTAADVALDINLTSYSDNITPTTTYCSDENETVRQEKLEELAAETNTTIDDLLEIPSEATKNSIIVLNAVYEKLIEKNNANSNAPIAIQSILDRFTEIDNNTNLDENATSKEIAQEVEELTIFVLVGKGEIKKLGLDDLLELASKKPKKIKDEEESDDDSDDDIDDDSTDDDDSTKNNGKGNSKDKNKDDDDSDDDKDDDLDSDTSDDISSDKDDTTSAV